MRLHQVRANDWGIIMISEPPPVIVDRQIALEADSDIAALPSQDELERWMARVPSMRAKRAMR